MEFELLHLADQPSGPLEALRRYLLNPRRQMQVWGENPPVLLGLLVLFAVAVETAIASRLMSGLGVGPEMVASAGRLTAALLLLELVVIAIASSVAGLFEKEGRPLAAFTYLNLDLMPLLLWLPVSLLARATGWAEGARLVVFLLLVVRVVARWREVVQLAFRLTRLQTYAAFYGAVTAVGTVCAVLLYVTVLGGFLSFLSR